MLTRRPTARWRVALILGGLGAMVVVAPTAAWSAQVTHGRVHEFAAGVTQALDIDGHAVMIRASGRTYVFVHVTGLTPNTAYGAHVHKAACGATDAAGSPIFADGHYRFDPLGPADALNEIWPEFTTNAAGVGNGFARNDGIAGPTAVAVVIHAPGGAKIACADLD